jgi:hypothetical protein
MDQSVQNASCSWAVHRQDDNGNRFLVVSGLSHEEATRVAADLEARGHKQLYWVESDCPADPSSCSRSSDT